MGEHAGACPAERREILRAGGDGHGQGVGLAVGGVTAGDPPADPHGLGVEAGAGQIVGQLQEFGGTGGEIDRGKQSPLDLFAGLPCSFERDRQRLIHPGLGMAAGDRGRDQVGRAGEVTPAAQFGGGDPQPREPIGRVAVGGLAGVGRGQVGGNRRPEVGGFEHGGGQRFARPHRGSDGRRLGTAGRLRLDRRGRRRDPPPGIAQPLTGRRDLVEPARDLRRAAGNRRIHRQANRRLRRGPLVNPGCEGLAVHPVEIA